MKKNCVVAFMILLSGCCKEETVAKYPLSDYEKILISYTEYDYIDYLNEAGEIIQAQTTPTQVETNTWQPGPESCSFTEFQKTYSHLFFNTENFTLKLEVSTLNEGYFSITIGREEPYFFGQGCRIPLNHPIEDRVTDISLAGHEFSDVLVFKNCSFDSDISQVLYSPEKGIEYLEFSNGSFYKIN